MGIFDKLFRRKKPNFDTPSYRPLSADELGLPELDKPSAATVPNDSLKSHPYPGSPSDDEGASVSPLQSYEPHTLSRQNPVYGGESQTARRDTELVLSKLDTIRSVLTNIDMRIARLEKIAGVDEKQDKGYRW
jgi:hypothetical protein